ncbi:MAG: hypothetical protein IPL86_11970 [Flavobacteriales bacterium]|nr:hypothetical protein [Flavobacteriales bacterium]
MAGDRGLFLPGNSRIHNVFRDQHGSILCYSGDVVGVSMEQIWPDFTPFLPHL